MDVDKKVASLFGYADIGVAALDGHEFSVFGGADGLKKSAQVDAVGLGCVNLYLAVAEAILVDSREDFLGQFQGDIDAYGFALGLRTFDTNV